MRRTWGRDGAHTARPTPRGEGRTCRCVSLKVGRLAKIYPYIYIYTCICMCSCAFWISIWFTFKTIKHASPSTTTHTPSWIHDDGSQPLWHHRKEEQRAQARMFAFLGLAPRDRGIYIYIYIYTYTCICLVWSPSSSLFVFCSFLFSWRSGLFVYFFLCSPACMFACLCGGSWSDRSAALGVRIHPLH